MFYGPNVFENENTRNNELNNEQTTILETIKLYVNKSEEWENKYKVI